MARSISRREFLRAGLLGIGGAALTACAAATTAPQAGGDTGTAATTAPPAASGPVTIRFTHVADPGELEIMQISIADFEERQPDIKVVAELVPEDGMDQKITTMVAGGAAPDVVYIHPSFVPLWAEQGVLVAQDDLADGDSEFGVDDFYPETVAYFVYDGKTYGYPYYSGPSVIYYNADFFEANGVELPTVSAEGFADDSDSWDWEKLVELAVPLTAGEGVDRTFGYWGTPYSLHWFNVAIWSYGAELWDAEMTQCKLSEPEAVEAIQYQVDMYTTYNISPRPDQAEGMPSGFNSGKVGMRYGIRGNVPGFKGLEFNLGTAPIPRGPKGRFCRNGPNAAGIVSQSKYVDASWELCKYMAGPKPGDLGGQRYQFEQQRAIPSRASLFDTPEFKDNLLPYESLEVYQNAAEHVKGMPLPARYSEIQRAWREQWDLMLLGEVTVQQGADTACAAIDPLLQET